MSYRECYLQVKCIRVCVVLVVHESHVCVCVCAFVCGAMCMCHTSLTTCAGSWSYHRVVPYVASLITSAFAAVLFRGVQMVDDDGS